MPGVHAQGASSPLVRVTRRDTAKTIDPFAVKSLIVQVQPQAGGPKALIAYTGLAELWGRTPMGRWLRETLRGVSQPFPDLMEHLLSQLNRKIASFNQVLIINVLMVNGENGEERHFGGLSNTQDFQTAEPEFEYQMHVIGRQDYFGNGSGADAVVAGGYRDMMQAHVANPDHGAADHMNLLATINRQVAEADPDGPVSPYSFVTCIGSDTQWTPLSQAFYEVGEQPVPFVLPMIVDGIDVSNFAEQIARSFATGTPPTLNEDGLRRNVDRRP